MNLKFAVVFEQADKTGGVFALTGFLLLGPPVHGC